MCIFHQTWQWLFADVTVLCHRRHHGSLYGRACCWRSDSVNWRVEKKHTVFSFEIHQRCKTRSSGTNCILCGIVGAGFWALWLGQRLLALAGSAPAAAASVGQIFSVSGSSSDMDNNSQGSGGLKGSLGGLFGGGAPEYSNTELAGVPCKYDDADAVV